MSDVDYGYYLGIKSLAAAIIFAVLYAILLPFYMARSYKQSTYVYIVLTLFCAIRVTTFSLRAVITQSYSASHSMGVNIAVGVLAGVGYFGLLYSAYTLVLDRELLLGPNVQRGWFTKILQNRRVVRVLLTVAVALGIAGSDLSFDSSTAAAGRACAEAGVYIFLAVTVALAIQTLMLVVHNFSTPRSERVYATRAIGEVHGVYFLLPLVVFLLIREVFFTATQHNWNGQHNEALWYPLAALPEFLAVALFAVPGLVPSRKELQGTEHEYGQRPPQQNV